MKLAFIPAKSRLQANFPDSYLEQLPKQLILCSSIQFIEIIKSFKSSFEEKGYSVSLLTGKHSSEVGQILGCDVLEHDYLEKEIEFLLSDSHASLSNVAIIYVGDGQFHPRAILFGNPQIPVYQFSPFTEELVQLTREDIDRLDKKREGLKTKFLLAKNIGIIESTKYGQRNLSDIDAIKAAYPDKNFYHYICDTIDFNDLINFMYVDCWINTACPRIVYEDLDRFIKPILNPDLIMEILNPKD